MSPENGSFVTHREFGRLEGKVDDIGTDVKLLLAAYNRDEGANEERRDLLEATRDRGARKLAWSGVTMGVVGSLWWVQDAIAKLTHHG